MVKSALSPADHNRMKRRRWNSSTAFECVAVFSTSELVYFSNYIYDTLHFLHADTPVFGVIDLCQCVSPHAVKVRMMKMVLI